MLPVAPLQTVEIMGVVCLALHPGLVESVLAVTAMVTRWPLVLLRLSRSPVEELHFATNRTNPVAVRVGLHVVCG